MSGPAPSAETPTRWCPRCERDVETIKSLPVTHSTEHGLVHTQREDCAGCLQRIHESVTGPGALEWAEAHGIEVTPS